MFMCHTFVAELQGSDTSQDLADDMQRTEHKLESGGQTPNAHQTHNRVVLYLPYRQNRFPLAHHDARKFLQRDRTCLRCCEAAFGRKTLASHDTSANAKDTPRQQRDRAF